MGEPCVSLFGSTLLLIVCVAAVAMGFAYRQVQSERRELERDLRHQAYDLAESQAKTVEPLLARRAYPELQTLVDRFKDGQKLAGMAVYDAAGSPSRSPQVFWSGSTACLPRPPWKPKRTRMRQIVLISCGWAAC